MRIADALYPPVMKTSDLVYSYSPHAVQGDNPHLVGYPDNNLLNRHERYEMLDFINAFLKHYKLNTVSDGQKVERIIKNHLPSTIRTHFDVNNWIASNWGNYA